LTQAYKTDEHAAMEITLEGRDVRLRPLTPPDAETLAAAASESREHYGLTTVPKGIEEARRYIAEANGRPDRIAFAVEWGARVVGTTSFLDIQRWTWPMGCHLQRIDRPDVVEIGASWLAHSAQRTRCNTECKYLLLKYAFEEWTVHRVSLRTDARNERSRRAIERLGARFEGIRRADKPAVDCTVRDSACYSIVVPEWPRVKKHLARLLDRE